LTCRVTDPRFVSPVLTAERKKELTPTSPSTQSIIDSTTWSLTEMCGTHLKIEREDIDPEDTAKFFDNVHSTAAQLLHFVMHCEADCYFQMAIAFKVQALPLTRQLTNLAGNSWYASFRSLFVRFAPGR
jgi:hypothetical protein